MNSEDCIEDQERQATDDNRVFMQSVRQRSAANAGASSSEFVEPNNWTCKFFKFGACKFGDSCRFVHQEPYLTERGEDGSRRAELFSESDGEPSDVSKIASKTLLFQETVGAASSSSATKPCTTPNIEEWVNAPEFVPSAKRASQAFASAGRPKSYAQAVRPEGTEELKRPINDLCPYFEAKFDCPRSRDECPYMHGDICELCGMARLHPTDEERRKAHLRDCVRQHEKNMELSFAVARSREKSCGVCFEVVLEKTSREQRFGILPNCNHCFCLSCIRKWRQAKQFDSKIVRACPECRVTSDFVCPSMYWVDTKEEKEKLITDYKGALKIRDCKYFKQGQGKCPFGNKCFYLHAFPDGTKVDVGPPPRLRRQVTRDTEIDFLQQFILWDFFTERDNRWLYSIDDLDDLAAFFSDSEDSDWSEYDFFFD